MKRLVSTLNLSREDWLLYRKKGIGGSDAGAVAGLNPYSGPMNVYYDKTTKTLPAKLPDSEAARVGRDMENYVAQRFTEATGLKVRRANAIFYDEKRPYMIADIDRMVVGGTAGLECKTVSPYLENRWKNGNVPEEYAAQVYHYMAVLGIKEFYIAALIYGRDFVIRRLTWDDRVIDSLRKIEQDFWYNHVEARIPPTPDGSEAADKVIAETFGIAVPGSTVELHGFANKLKKREKLGSQIEHLQKEKASIEQEVKLYLGEAERAEGEGYSVSWKNVPQNRLDTERLKKEEPEIYKEYVKSLNYRRLTIKAA